MTSPITSTVEVKPLFVPLKKEYYEAFECGEKTVEYRAYGPRWNEKTCWVGRPVTISCGYGNHRRLQGEVQMAEKCPPSPAFKKIYGEGKECFGILIKLNQWSFDHRASDYE